MAKTKQVSEPVTPEVDLNEVEAKLSKRNQDYVFKLKKALDAEQLSEVEKNTLLQKMLPEMLTAQHKGQPATQLYGTVTEAVDHLLHAPKPPIKTPLWQQMVDNGLIFLIMYLAFNGIASYFSKKGSANTIGITSIVATAILAGVIMTYPMRYSQMPKDQRPPFWRMLLNVVLLTLVFVAIYGVTMIIPKVLNPVLPGVVQIVLAVVLFGVRYVFKRKYHITGTFFS